MADALRGIVLVTWIDYDLSDPLAGGALEAAGLQVRLAPRHGERSPAELRTLLDDSVAAIVSTDPFTRTVLEHSPRLRVIARVGVGTDSIDLHAATDCGVAVTTTPGANTNAVADHTLALMLAAVRRVAEHDRLIRRGEWRRAGPMLAGELHAATVGIIGFGAIGRAVARRLDGFGAPVLIHDPALGPSDDPRLVDLATLLRNSDIVSLHLPYRPGDQPLLDAPTLAMLRPGAIVVNTARGRLIDEHALTEALASGALRAAALDVFEQEPPPPARLQELPNVVLTPHVAGLSNESNTAMTRQATLSVLDVLQHGITGTVINPDALHRASGRVPARDAITRGRR